MHVRKQATFEEPSDPVAVDNEPLVIHQRSAKTHNQALIIFVHGLGGSRYGKKATWGQFPTFVYEDFPELDVGLYAYRTLFGRVKFWESVPLDTEAEVFGGIIRDATQYKTILLVGHSMGGLLCTATIRWLVNTGQRDTLSRLGGLLLMATPQTGSQRVPKFLSWFSKDFHALRPHGALVTDIHDTFINHIALDESTPAPSKVVIPTWAVLGASDFWVDKLSASLGLPARRMKVVRGSHTAIVKPRDKQTDAYLFVRECLTVCLNRATASVNVPAPVSPQSIWNVPYPPNPFFTGRGEVLEQLRGTLTSNGAAALSGLGGIGKTQIAIEYAHRHRADYKAVLWAKADSREALVADFVGIAALLNLPQKDIPGQTLAVAAVKRWLADNTDWLLVLDNADDLALVRDFLPACDKGHVLLTTRAQATGGIAQRIKINEMELEEGALFLLHRTKLIAPDAQLAHASDSDRRLAKDIAKEMDGLPLALDQAGAYIRKISCSFRESTVTRRDSVIPTR